MMTFADAAQEQLEFEDGLVSFNDAKNITDKAGLNTAKPSQPLIIKNPDTSLDKKRRKERARLLTKKREEELHSQQ